MMPAFLKRRHSKLAIAVPIILVGAGLLAILATAGRVQPKVYCRPAGGDTYCIPVEYFILPPIDPSGFLVRVQYPDMAAVPLDQAGGVRILVRDEHSNSTPPGRRTTSSRPVVGTLYGLTREQDAGPGHDDIFYEPDGDTSQSVGTIACHKPEPANPQFNQLCRHAFRHGTVIYTISYGRHLLPDWSNVKRAAIEFIESHKQ